MSGVFDSAVFDGAVFLVDTTATGVSPGGGMFVWADDDRPRQRAEQAEAARILAAVMEIDVLDLLEVI